MKLSKSQLGLHWRLWLQAKAKLMPGRETWTKHEEDARRHELYLRATGRELSLTEIGNDEFDQVIGEMKAIIEPGNLHAQLQALNGQRKRLLFGIRREARKLGADQSYVAGIVRAMNAEGNLGSSDLEELAPAELTKVMIALKKQAQRSRAGVKAEAVEIPF